MTLSASELMVFISSAFFRIKCSLVITNFQYTFTDDDTWCDDDELLETVAIIEFRAPLKIRGARAAQGCTAIFNHVSD